MPLCHSSSVLCWWSLITVTRSWLTFLQSFNSRPSSIQQPVWSVILEREITLHLCWKDPGGSSTLHSSVNRVWHYPSCPTNFSKSLEWSPDSVWDHWVCQCSSYQRPEGHHWVTEHFLSLPPGCETVCHQQSLLRQHCIHAVEPWKLICSPQLSHHLSYIICILS